MGLLNTLLGKAEPMGPAWTAFLKTQGLKPGQDVGQTRVTELLRQYSEQQQASGMAPGLAKQLGRQFGQRQADQYDEFGRPTHYQSGDPEAAAQVGLMMDPATQVQGVAGAMQMLAPQSAEQRAAAAQRQPLLDEQIAGQRLQNRGYEQGYQQAQQLFPLQLEQAKTQIAQNLAAIRASGISGQAQQLTFFNTVRGQYQALPAIKMLGEAQSAYQQATQAVHQGSALGARVAMIKLAKLADPTSVVREGEVENIRQGYGVLSQLDTALRAAGDKGLGPEQVRMFMDVMDSLYAPALELGSAATVQYNQLETEYGARPGEFTNSTGIDWGLIPGAWRGSQPGSGAINRTKSWGARSH